MDGTISHDSRVLANSTAGNGSESVPGMPVGFDYDTGFFRKASNTIGVTTGGSEAMSINASGNVAIVGSLSKGSGSFKIDHPLSEKNSTHHLVHSFVESPQADNIYRGRATLENGAATINLDSESGMTDGTFVALNTDIQSFVTNETDWDAVKSSVTGNILTIESQNNSSSAIVSWLVIGERQDQHIKDADFTDENGKVIVEPLKTN